MSRASCAHAASGAAVAFRRREAEALIENADFPWHQPFELVPGVETPGRSDVRWLLDVAGVETRSNGPDGARHRDRERRNGFRVRAARRDAGRRGRRRPDRHLRISPAEGVHRVAGGVRFGSVDDLEETLGGETFDLVICWGVLYHLRDPLLGLDGVRATWRGDAWIETQIAGGEIGDGISRLKHARFYRKELLGDPSNWFVPTVSTLVDWCLSCGFTPLDVSVWPQPRHHRATVHVVPTPGRPECAASRCDRSSHR